MKFEVRRPDHNLALMRLRYLKLIKVAGRCLAAGQRVGNIKHGNLLALSFANSRSYLVNSYTAAGRHKTVRFSVCVFIEVMQKCKLVLQMVV